MPPMSLFLGVMSFWSGEEYLKSSMFEAAPQRTMVIFSTTALASMFSTSPMPEKGPNVIAALQPSTSVKKLTA